MVREQETAQSEGKSKVGLQRLCATCWTVKPTKKSVEGKCPFQPWFIALPFRFNIVADTVTQTISRGGDHSNSNTDPNNDVADTSKVHCALQASHCINSVINDSCCAEDCGQHAYKLRPVRDCGYRFGRTVHNAAGTRNPDYLEWRVV